MRRRPATSSQTQQPAKTRRRDAAKANAYRFALLDRNQLDDPETVWEQLDWIEIRGVPDYLDQPGPTQSLPDGRTIVMYPPRNRDAYRREVQRVYMEAFDQSDLIGKRRILRRYTSNFPHLAFDADSDGAWLWPLWQEWRARYEKTDRALLRALANGIQARGWGWMSKRRAHAWIVAQAKRRLSEQKADSHLKALYDRYRKNAKSPHADVRARAEREFLDPLIRRLVELTGYETSGSELLQRSLNRVLRLAVSRMFRVRERDLH